MKNRGGFQEGDHPRDDYGMFTGDGAISKIHEADKEQALSTISGKIKDKDWDKFVEAYDKALDSAQLGFVSPNAAKKIRTSHKFTFESDPDNESMHKHTKEKRGKSVTDPSIVLRFGDEYIAIDGQHRLNRAIKDGENARVAIVDGSLLEEFGITRASFEGKKSFANDIFTWSDWDLVKRFFNSPAFDRASYEAMAATHGFIPTQRNLF